MNSINLLSKSLSYGGYVYDDIDKKDIFVIIFNIA